MSTASEGPFLHDDGPDSPHTGTPRSANRPLLLIMLGTVLVGVAMVLLLPVVRGTPAEQSTAVVDGLYAALAAGDLEAADQMLCQAERQRLADADPTEDYVRGDDPEVTGATDGEVGGDSVQLVTVRFADGTTATVTVVNENGAHVCGIE